MANGTTGQPASQPLPCGIFDWIDRGPGTLGATYEGRLRMLEAADRAGFYCYHLAEHHGTPLGMAPSPSLFLAAASQRTSRIRLGPLVYLLPIYHPVRLLQEICMLDHLSGGRLELGVGRGASPHELALLNVDVNETRAMFQEALAIITTGLATGKVSYEGQYYSCQEVEVMLRPVQQPYPPLWYPTSNADTVPWIASQGISTLFGQNVPSLVETRERIDAYWQAYAAHRADPDRVNGHVAAPKAGIVRHVYVAETDAQAHAEAQAGFADFLENYAYLWVKHGNVARHARKSDFEEGLATRRLLFGSPTTVRAMVQECVDATGANYFVGSFAWGSLSTEQILRSIDLFAREVMPAVRAPALVPAAD